MTILFPSSYQNIKKIDFDLQDELNAVLENGCFSVAFFDYYEWFHNQTLKIFEYYGHIDFPVIYRGWMMKPEQYHQFYQECKKYNLQLITTPEQYTLLHIYPNIYPVLQEDAVPMLNYPLHAHIPIDDVINKIGNFMVKDYVKSVKGTDFPLYFTSETNQKQFDDYMERFYQLRGDLLTGGILCKSYVPLKKYNEKFNEFRVFYMNGAPITICRNSNQLNITPTPPMELIQKYNKINSPFYTIDFAELKDQTWIIIEAGDGQVSGPSPGQNLCQFFRDIYYSFLQEKEIDTR